MNSLIEGSFDTNDSDVDKMWDYLTSSVLLNIQKYMPHGNVPVVKS